MKDVDAVDTKILAGAKIYNLILNAFPDWVRFNSTYATQPFYTSAASATIYEEQKTNHLYCFTPPTLIKPPVKLTRHAAAKRVLTDLANFTAPRSEYLPSYKPDDPVAHSKQQEEIRTALGSDTGMQQFSNFATSIMFSLLKKITSSRSRSRGVYRVDIVKESVYPSSTQMYSAGEPWLLLGVIHYFMEPS